MALNDLATKDPTAQLYWEFNFADEVPSGVSVTSITTTVPSGLTRVSETNDLPNMRSFVLIAGGTHGRTYDVVSSATLSNDETLIATLTLRIFTTA